MPMVRTIAPEHFSFLLVFSRLMMMLMTHMQITMNMKFMYQIPRVNGFKKIPSLMLFPVVDSNMKQGLEDLNKRQEERDCLLIDRCTSRKTNTELATPRR